MQPNSSHQAASQPAVVVHHRATLACPAIAFTITAGCSSRYLTTVVIGFSLLEGKGKISI